MLIMAVSSSPRSRVRPRGGSAEQSNVPELPRILIDTTFAMPNGTVWTCVTTADLTNALANAVGGDIIVLVNGNVFQGPFNLRARADTQFIYIVDSRIFNGTFPRAPGLGMGLGLSPVTRPLQRARPSDFSPTTSIIRANNANAAITTDPGAAYYRFCGIEISGATSPTGTGVALVDIRDQTGTGGNLAFQPHHIYIDRCYIHGHAGVDCRRGVLTNGQYLAVVDSWIEEIHCVGFDSQGINGYNGAGPFKIVNCYIATASENIIFGGADPAVQGLVPSDIEVDLCHCWKDPAWIGQTLGVKNLYEHKNGSRLSLQRCVLENSWQDAQTGNAILFQPLSDNNTAPWTAITDLTINFILVKSAGSGMVLASRVAFDNPGQPGSGVLPTTPLSRVAITNILFEDTGLRTPANGFPTVNDGGRLMQITGDIQYLSIDHLTGKAPQQALSLDNNGLGPMKGFQLRRSIMGRGDYGIFGASVGEGIAGLTAYAGDYVYDQNILYDSLASPGDGSFNPTGRYGSLTTNNTFIDLGAPGSENAVGFVDPATEQWGLQATSPYFRAGSDGKDLGCDVAGLNAAIIDVVQTR